MANNDNLDPKDLNKAPAEEIDTSTGTAEDVEAVMKKYDRESNVRRWEGTPGLVVIVSHEKTPFGGNKCRGRDRPDSAAAEDSFRITAS